MNRANMVSVIPVFPVWCGLISVLTLSRKGVFGDTSATLPNVQPVGDDKDTTDALTKDAMLCPSDVYDDGKKCFPCPRELGSMQHCDNCPPGTRTVDTACAVADDVHFTVHIELKYQIPDNCTKVHEDNVMSIIRSRVISLNSYWPGLCTNSTCSNAHVVSTCESNSTSVVKTIIEITDTLPILSSTRTNTTKSTKAVLNDTSSDGFDLQNLLGAMLKDIMIRIDFTCNTCASGNRLPDPSIASPSIASLVLSVVGVCVGVAILVLLTIMFVKYMRRRKGDDAKLNHIKFENDIGYLQWSTQHIRKSEGNETDVRLNNIKFENATGPLCWSTQHSMESLTTFSVRSWTPKNGEPAPEPWTASTSSLGDELSDASAIYDTAEPVSPRTDYMTPTVPAIFTMGPALPPRPQTVTRLSQQTSDDVARYSSQMTSRYVPNTMMSRNVMTIMTPGTVPISMMSGNVSTSIMLGNVPSTVTSRNVPTSIASWNGPNTTTYGNVPTKMASWNGPNATTYGHVPTRMASLNGPNTTYGNVPTKMAPWNGPSTTPSGNVPTKMASQNALTFTVATVARPTPVSFSVHHRQNSHRFSQKTGYIVLQPTFV